MHTDRNDEAESCFSQFSNAPKKNRNLLIQQNSVDQSDKMEILTIYHLRSVVLRLEIFARCHFWYAY